MTQHTPGPWMVSGVRGRINREECHFVLRYDEATKKDEQIAAVWYNPKTNLGWADARLIAAAPDLLEALKGLINDPCTDFEYAGQMNRCCIGCGNVAMDDSEIKHSVGCFVIRGRAAIAKATGEA